LGVHQAGSTPPGQTATSCRRLADGSGMAADPGFDRTRDTAPAGLIEGVRDALSCGDSVQPPAEADQRRGSAEDVPEAVEPAPARCVTTRRWPDDRSTAPPARVALPGSGRRPAGCRRAGPWCGGPRPGYASARDPWPCPKPPVQQARHAAGVEHLAEPGQRDELVLVAAARPAAVTPQQVTPRRWTPPGPGRCGRGVWRHTRPSGWPFRWGAAPGRQPVDHDRLAGECLLRQPLAQVRKVVMKVPSGWQYPSVASASTSRSRLSPTSVLEIPTMRPARR
jgi:hypothetical protein